MMLCLLLVLSERVINLAAPIAFKHMVEVLSAVVRAPPDPAAGQLQHAIVSGLRRLLTSVTGQSLQMQAQQDAASGVSAAVLHAAAAANGTQALPAAAAGAAAAAPGLVSQGDAVLAPFWVLFYPYVSGGCFFWVDERVAANRVIGCGPGPLAICL
jgi:hypothetical protein